MKILAEKAGLASVGMEVDQIVLRFPPQNEKITLKELAFPGNYVRSGKNSYWFAFRKYGEQWQEMLLEILTELGELAPVFVV